MYVFLLFIKQNHKLKGVIMKKQKNVRLFDVAFKEKIMKEVIQYYIDLIPIEKLTQEEANKTIQYGIEMVLGRIIHESLPRVVEAMKHDVKGYRVIIEAVTDKDSKMLEIPFNVEDVMDIKPETINDEKTEKKILKKLNDI